MRAITALLAQAGERVHVIAHRWSGAPLAREESCDGRLVLHRVALDEAVSPAHDDPRVPLGLLASRVPAQAFAWQAARLAESLIASEPIDVIEAQEWEAPLYYLQVRRALGLGPAARPPCVVHMHSPTEGIFAANGWDTAVADYAPAAALEEYCVTHADAVLCPSRFMAHETIARYGVDAARVTVIPYPRGDVPVIARAPAVWTHGSICHVGRLELRKGVLEWAEAIARVAAEHPAVRFDFVGGDTPVQVTGGPTVGSAMLTRLPRAVRPRVTFHGSQDRAGVVGLLGAARTAVVPSRWENFPYSCIEAMSTGLPVIVSPNGGMREMLTDGESGWIAPAQTPAGLAEALRRALAVPPAARQAMGAAAAAAIRRVCDNGDIVRQHVAFKSSLARTASRAAAPPVTVAPAAAHGAGVAVVVVGGGAALARGLAALRAQRQLPVAVRVIADGPLEGPEFQGAGARWQVVPAAGDAREVAATAAAASLAADTPGVQVIVWIDSDVALEPDALATCAAAFEHEARLGVLSAWLCDAGPGGELWLPPSPPQPQGWHDDGPAPWLAVRASALGDTTAQSRLLAAQALLRQGWTASTYPAVLGIVSPDAARSRRGRAVRYSSMAGAVQRLHMPLLTWLRTCSPADRRAFLADGLRSPGRSVRWLAGRAVRAWRPAPNSPAVTPQPPNDLDEGRRNAARGIH